MTLCFNLSFCQDLSLLIHILRGMGFYISEGEHLHCVGVKKDLHARIYQMLKVALEIEEYFLLDMEPQRLRVIVATEIFIKQRDLKYDFMKTTCKINRGL